MISLLVPVKRDMTQVACGLFVLLTFNFDRVGLSLFELSGQ